MDYLISIGIDVTEKEIIQKKILQQKEELELIFNYSKVNYIKKQIQMRT